MLPNVDSILFESDEEIKTEILKSSENSKETHSIMESIPLLLEKRRNGIVEDNLVSKDKGIEKWKIGKMIGGGGLVVCIKHSISTMVSSPLSKRSISVRKIRRNARKKSQYSLKYTIKT